TIHGRRHQHRESLASGVVDPTVDRTSLPLDLTRLVERITRTVPKGVLVDRSNSGLRVPGNCPCTATRYGVPVHADPVVGALCHLDLLIAREVCRPFLHRRRTDDNGVRLSQQIARCAVVVGVNDASQLGSCPRLLHTAANGQASNRPGPISLSQADLLLGDTRRGGTRAARVVPERLGSAAGNTSAISPGPHRLRRIRVSIVPDLHRACNDLNRTLLVGIGAGLPVRTDLEVVAELEVSALDVHLLRALKLELPVDVDEQDVVHDSDLEVVEVPEIVPILDERGSLLPVVVIGRIPANDKVKAGVPVALGLDTDLVHVRVVDLTDTDPGAGWCELDDTGTPLHVVGACAVPPEVVVAVLSNLAVLATRVAGAAGG